MFNRVEQRLLNDWQRDLPLEPRPYARMAEQIGISETEAIDTLRTLGEKQAISRVGAVIRPGTIGASTLAAMAVPPCCLEEIADQVSSHREVNHNYERDHHFNLWFVVTACHADALSAVLDEIENESGLHVMSLPLVEAYHIDLGFDLGFPSGRAATETPKTDQCRARKTAPRVDDADRRILWRLESGLPLTSRPYAEVGEATDLDETEVMQRLGRLIDANVIRRLGVIVRHHEVGFDANAMVVWDVPDSRMKQAVDRLTSSACVTLCYQRPRRLPDWPYNLFSMIHGTCEESVRSVINELKSDQALSGLDYDILFSRRRFKQTGARYRPVLSSGENREVA